MYYCTYIALDLKQGMTWVDWVQCVWCRGGRAGLWLLNSCHGLVFLRQLCSYSCLVNSHVWSFSELTLQYTQSNVMCTESDHAPVSVYRPRPCECVQTTPLWVCTDHATVSVYRPRPCECVVQCTVEWTDSHTLYRESERDWQTWWLAGSRNSQKLNTVILLLLSLPR